MIRIPDGGEEGRTAMAATSAPLVSLRGIWKVFESVTVLRGIDLGGARAVAERLRKSIKRLEIPVEGGPVRPTVSAGCSRLKECEKSCPAELLAHADERLYQAKRDGRDRVS